MRNSKFAKKVAVFWFVTPCTVIEIFKLYGTTYCRVLNIKNIVIK